MPTRRVSIDQNSQSHSLMESFDEDLDDVGSLSITLQTGMSPKRKKSDKKTPDYTQEFLKSPIDK